MSKLVALVALLSLTFAPSLTAAAVDRTATEILAEYKTVQIELEKAMRSPEGKETAKEPARKVCELTLELAQVDPQNPELVRMYSNRWALLATRLDQGEVAQKEIAVLLTKNPAPALATEARWSLAQILMWDAGTKGTPESLAAARAAVDAFVAKDGADRVRTPDVLANMAALYKDDPKAKAALYKLLIDKYGDTKRGEYARGKLRQVENLGKPFELSFTDAITGKPVSMADFKGKVVVVDFWATWCGPCVRSLPHLKELYAKYKDKGLAVVGVSLDRSEAEGGLSALKAFVEKNAIPWPQYYQGNYWSSQFSSGWGINSIPCVFVVDPMGNLYDMDAKDKLDTMIPELLGKFAQ